MTHPSIEGLPIVTADEMRRIEELAYGGGQDQQAFMESAGLGVAQVVEKFIETFHVEREIYLLIGKGNNGGDALVAGLKLMQKGFAVTAYALFPQDQCSPLCQKQMERFRAFGGKLHVLLTISDLHFGHNGLILDGIVGTGFVGKAEGMMAKMIELANESGLPIIAIDIPSGLNGTTGETAGRVIRAVETAYLGLPKIGFFLGGGWDHVGRLVAVDFGLNPQFLPQAHASAYLMSEKDLGKLLPPIKRSRHKYETGYLIGVGGSKGIGGALLLSAYAAMRAGAGIVRLFYPEELHEEIANAPLEILKEAWDLKDLTRIKKESERAKALLVGPGMGRSEETENALGMIIRELKLPAVYDADALNLIARHPEWKFLSHTILTPHRQEMKRLLQRGEPTLEICQQFAEERGVTLVLKGGPTFIFHPGCRPLAILRGDPGMATAGTGDVLTGIIGALLAQGADSRIAAALGVTIHGLAGELVAQYETSYGMIASDLIEYLPEVFSLILSEKSDEK